jgi:hypothetical protein
MPLGGSLKADMLLQPFRGQDLPVSNRPILRHPQPSAGFLKTAGQLQRIFRRKLNFSKRPLCGHR